MSHTSVLSRMLHPTCLIALEDHYESKKVCLVESQATDSFIEIHRIPVDAFVIDLDRVFNNQLLFQGNCGECKRADYLIISESAQRVLFIEMKRSNAPAQHIIHQLRGALCAFEYCQVIAREFFQETSFLNEYQKRFISIRHTGGEKRKTQIERTAAIGETHCAPDQPLRVSWANTIQFNKLAS
ncbi:MAG: hypothetical protein WBP46_18710 [Thiolinea sp.]